MYTPKNTLEVDSIVYGFTNERMLISDCYIHCATGDIIGLLGRNGTGKTTLFKLIYGTLYTPNKFIRINKKVYKYPYKSRMIAYLPQDSFLPKNISVRRLFYLLAIQDKKIEQLIAFERIQNILSSQISSLSVGIRRYLEVLVVLYMDHPFVLLDEPFSGIEPLYVAELKLIIKAVSKTKGIILSDHNYRSVLAISTQIILLKNSVCIQLADANLLQEHGYLPEDSGSE